MSSSSSITPPSYKYDVFLSFEGEDTRGFTNYFYDALLGKEIGVFIDLQLYNGDDVSSAVHKQIEESRISVVVFSKNYAKSRWCLDGLFHILECEKMYAQVVMSVFYNIDPSQVREQTGSFRDAFEQHEKRFGKSLVQKWRSALTAAANISGYDVPLSADVKFETVLIQQLVYYIWKRLDRSPPWLNRFLTLPSYKYDVFLSFEGQDTRDFTDLLYHALLGNGIKPFIDLQLLNGDDISPGVHEQIKESRISVVVFSENYVDSEWSLHELVHILECKKRYAQVVIPVFYNIARSDVRKQTGSFRNTFGKHGNLFEKSLVQTWSNALTEVANLPGHDLQHTN